MSFTAVRKLTVVSFFVIGGLLICGNLMAGTAPSYSDSQATIENTWGATFDEQGYNKGSYYTGVAGDTNPAYGTMPQEDTSTPTKIDAPFDMTLTPWSREVNLATGGDVAMRQPAYFQTNHWYNCSQANLSGAIYAMNDADHIYISLDLEADGINSADRLFLYFDPDFIQPVQEFVDGSSFCVGVKLGNVTAFNPGTGNTSNQGMDFCNGYWKDWDNSGSVDTWEAADPWPYIGAQDSKTNDMEITTGDSDDIVVCPRTVSEWGDSGYGTLTSGAYWDNPDTMLNNMPESGFKPAAIQMQFKIPLENLGCSVALGSDIGFAIKWYDDMDGTPNWGTTAYNGTIDDCTYEHSWWPTDIEASGNPGAGWEKYDASYMGVMQLNSSNLGDRLWGAWYDVKADRTSYLVLKNVSDELAKTKVKFYQSLHGDASERWAPLPGAGGLIYSECVEIPEHGVSTLQLETIGGGVLVDTKGTIEVTNTALAGYDVALVGLDSGAPQKYAWSVDLETTPLTTDEFNGSTGDSTGMLLANKWYIVGEPGWDFNTSIVIVNPNPGSSAKANIVLYPASYLNMQAPGTPMNKCADVGFHPDFDKDYSGTSECGDVTSDADDVINIPPHQAVELRMHELLNEWVATWKHGDLSFEITDPVNTYWHFRKGTVEIFVRDGDDADTDTLNEALFGVTARESAFQGWAESLQRYYE